MRRGLRGILLTAAAAASVIMTAMPGSASTWSISPAGNFTATLSKGTTIWLKDLKTGITVECTPSSAKGDVPKAGRGLSGNGIATISSHTWGTSTTPCPLPFGDTFTAVSLNTPWKINAVSYNASVDGGQTTGTITAPGTGVRTKISCVVLGASGSMTIGGTQSAPASARFLYDNNSHLLAITGTKNLKVLSSSCPDYPVGDGMIFFTSPVSQAGSSVTHGYLISSKIHLTSP